MVSFLSSFHNPSLTLETTMRRTDIVIVVSISGLLAYGNGLWVIMVQQLRFVSLLILYWTQGPIVLSMRDEGPTNKVAKEPAKLGGI